MVRASVRVPSGSQTLRAISGRPHAHEHRAGGRVQPVADRRRGSCVPSSIARSSASSPPPRKSRGRRALGVGRDGPVAEDGQVELGRRAARPRPVAISEASGMSSSVRATIGATSSAPDARVGAVVAAQVDAVDRTRPARETSASCRASGSPARVMTLRWWSGSEWTSSTRTPGSAAGVHERRDRVRVAPLADVRHGVGEGGAGRGRQARLERPRRVLVRHPGPSLSFTSESPWPILLRLLALPAPVLGARSRSPRSAPRG